jgi:hypothetical protein
MTGQPRTSLNAPLNTLNLEVCPKSHIVHTCRAIHTYRTILHGAMYEAPAQRSHCVPGLQKVPMSVSLCCTCHNCLCCLAIALVQVGYKYVDDLASVWCDWAEMELRHQNFKSALELMVRATAAPQRPRKLSPDEERALPVQERLYRWGGGQGPGMVWSSAGGQPKSYGAWCKPEIYFVNTPPPPPLVHRMPHGCSSSILLYIHNEYITQR